MAKEFQLDVYSDIACAWCYIGWKRLKRTLADPRMQEYQFTLKPRFLPYLINEQLDDKPISKEEMFESKFMGGDDASAVRRKISAEGETEGIHFNWDTRAQIRQTKPAHRVLERAYDVGGFDLQARMAEKLYAAFHEHAVDIGDPTELAKITSSEPEFGSYEESLRFVESDEGLYELDKKLEKAISWGIEQVPTFILDETDAYREAITPEAWFKNFDILSRAYGLTK